MIGLITLAFLIGLGIYYVTTLDFEIGSGISEDKSKARYAEYEVTSTHSEDEKKIENPDD